MRYSTSDSEEEPRRLSDSLPACSLERKLVESESDHHSSTESLQEKLKQPIIAPFSDRLTKRSLSSNDLKLESKDFKNGHKLSKSLTVSELTADKKPLKKCTSLLSIAIHNNFTKRNSGPSS